MYEECLARKARMETCIKLLEKELADLPNGALVCSKVGDGYKYYHSYGQGKARRRAYIPRSRRGLAVDLARKRVYQALLDDCRRELRALNAYLKEYGPEPAQSEKVSASEGVRELLSEYYSEWQEVNRSDGTYMPEGLKNEGPDGEKVRSKGEADIFWDLRAEKLPCVYEKKLWLGDRMVRPDFVIKHPVTGQEIVWEHFGAMDKPDYRRRAFRKLWDYVEHGYLPGWNLIITFENEAHPLSRRQIQAQIQYFFGDWLDGKKKGRK